MSEPLASRLRPASLADVVGQTHLLGPDGPIVPWVAARQLPALLLAGPPGTGKTTIASLLADAVGVPFLTLNATTHGIADLRKTLEEADRIAAAGGRSPLLFLDELHRWAKNVQDGLLAAVEAGRVLLVGATTENPWGGAIIPALLSRMTVLRLARLDDPELDTLLDRGAAALQVTLDDEARRNLRGYAEGDGRRLLTLLEGAVAVAAGEQRSGITARDVVRVAQRRPISYDRSGVVSAMIKSIRGGDVEAALYYAAVQLEAEEDARHLARRLIIAAGEEVGASDPAALPMAVAALEAVEKVGLPEAHYPLAAVIVYLARTRRDWAAGAAFHRARELVRERGAATVPAHLRASAKTYRHPAAGDTGDQAYLPTGVERHTISSER
jgi:putative ATPase